MKELTKKEKLILCLSFLFVIISVVIMINQIKLHKQLSDLKNDLTPSSQISWFEDDNNVESKTEGQPSQASETSSAQTSKQGRTYIVNVNSKKIHSPDCQYAVNMKPENKEVIVTDSLSDYFDRGYSLCSKCGGE